MNRINTRLHPITPIKPIKPINYVANKQQSGAGKHAANKRKEKRDEQRLGQGTDERA